MPKRAYLIDGSGYIFRAFFATPRLSTRAGFPTNALFGFTKMLLKLLQDCDSDLVVMVFDAGKKTFRNDMYADYKANRPDCPEDLVKQMPYFREMSKALGLTVLEQEGYEADDILATMARRFVAEGLEVSVVSADKDLLQLVTEHVEVWDTMKDKRYGAKEVEARFGVPPELVVDYLALTGDSSDNIPGLSGVGEKTATQLIQQYGDVESIIAAQEKIAEDKTIRSRAKIAAALASETEIVRLSKRLAQVEYNVPVNLFNGTSIQEASEERIEQALSRKSPDGAALQALVEKFEFQSLFRNVHLPSVGVAKNTTSARWVTVLKKDFPDWVKKFQAVKSFALDAETTSLDPHEASIVGLSFCWSDEEAYYIPFRHQGEQDPLGSEQVDYAQFVYLCGPILSDPDKERIGHNVKYDYSVLATNEIKLPNLACDTMLAAYLLQPERNGLKLSQLSREFLDYRMSEFSEIVEEGSDFSQVNIEEATKYSAEDAWVAWKLAARLQEDLQKANLTPVFRDIEMPLVPILADMELAGIALDSELLGKLSDELSTRLFELERKLYEIAGREFNLNSPKQLSEVMFHELGIPTKGVKKTKTGGFSTNSDVLENLRDAHPFCALLLDYRMLFKLKSTYVDVLPALVSEKTGRLHSRFHQAVTATGRLSSSDPNLQNIPIQSEDGKRIRLAFIPQKGSLLLSADYSQIELRLLAHMSGDKNLISAYQAGEDIHSRTAREVLGIPGLLQVSAHERRIGKTINFGIIYGMGPFRLSKDLGIPMGEASRYIESYFRRYPKVREYFDGIEEQVASKGYVETLFGRKRFIAEIDLGSRDQGFLRRAAMNAPIQGSAADIIKLAMIACTKKLQAEGMQTRLLLQIHDELVFEVPEQEQEKAKEIVREAMEQVAQLHVPLQVDVGVGRNWGEAH